MLTISIKQIPLASFALAVNNVAIISSITVRNNTPNNYEGLKVKITFDPEFADTVVENIGVIRLCRSIWQRLLRLAILPLTRLLSELRNCLTSGLVAVR